MPSHVTELVCTVQEVWPLQERKQVEPGHVKFALQVSQMGLGTLKTFIEGTCAWVVLMAHKSGVVGWRGGESLAKTRLESRITAKNANRLGLHFIRSSFQSAVYRSGG